MPLMFSCACLSEPFILLSVSTEIYVPLSLSSLNVQTLLVLMCVLQLWIFVLFHLGFFFFSLHLYTYMFVARRLWLSEELLFPFWILFRIPFISGFLKWCNMDTHSSLSHTDPNCALHCLLKCLSSCIKIIYPLLQRFASIWGLIQRPQKSVESS